MLYTTLIFDLDGTLSDPALGVVRCINFALTSFDQPPRADHEITRHIGPPLEQILALLSDDDDPAYVSALAARYRERYSELGYRENALYPEAKATLAALKNFGFRLGVCTSKLRPNAIKILELFDLGRFFDFISGPSETETKSEQLKDLLQSGTIDFAALMIGDRAIDLQAAHENRLESAGVLWGYGEREELESEQPAFLFDSFSELFHALTQC